MATVDIIRLFPNTNVTFQVPRPTGITGYRGHLFSQIGAAPPVLLTTFTPTEMLQGATFAFTAAAKEHWIIVVTANVSAATRFNSNLSYTPPPPPPSPYQPALQPGSRLLEWVLVSIPRPVNG